MGKLIITDSSGNTQEYPLSKERVTIGRHVDNDIALADKAVSGHHAQIITILRDSFLEDLNSTNGTQVNNKAVSKHPLAHGDLITIGRNHLQYEGEVPSQEFDRTVVLKPGQSLFGSSAPAEPERDHSSVARPGTSTPPAAPKIQPGRLLVTSGPNEGRELELSKPMTTIGKAGVQVVAITRRNDGYYIVHVSGQEAGRPRVNGNDIDVHARRLQDNDRIEVSGTTMTFLLG